MPVWSRIWNVFRHCDIRRQIDDELAGHVQEAIDSGREPAKVRKAFGSPLRHREASLDVRLLGGVDSLRADIVFGGRQLWNAKTTSAVTILSLGLATGSCMSAFRIIDALLLRPLPIREPDRLYALFCAGIGSDGKPRVSASNEYPLFEQMRAAVAQQSDLIAASYATRRDLTYSSNDESEKAYIQYVWGSMFDKFG